MGKDTTKEMTSGSTMKLILGFAVPLLMGMLFQQVYGLVDTIIVGRFLGVSALAAVGATGSINFLIIGFCQGICNGFALPIAQRFGARDYDGLRKYVGNSAVLSILFGGTLTVLTVVFCRDILLLMRTPSDIIDLSYQYIVVIFAGIPAIILYNILSAYLRSLGDSITPVVFLILAAVLNVGLDLLFIVVFHWGVFGAAFATVLAQAVSGILCLILIIWKFEILHLLCKISFDHGTSYGITIFDHRYRKCHFANCGQLPRFRCCRSHDSRKQNFHVCGMSFRRTWFYHGHFWRTKRRCRKA